MIPYAQPSDSLTDALARLQTHVDELPGRLMTLPPDELTEKRPGKWSRKEVLGHLIDSAINNLQRFTEAYSATDELVIRPYNQNELVEANHYHTRSLPQLLDLWISLNEQIDYVATQLPANALVLPVRHAGSGPTNRDVSWLISDYVAHLEHHLRTL